jgi:hypothetical protein
MSGPGRRLRRLAVPAAVVVVLVSLVGWAPPQRQPAPVAPAAGPGGLVSHHGTHRGSAAVPGSAAEAGLRLQALLGQHTVLAADMMRGRLRGDPDLAQAANSALGRNTEALGQLVALVAPTARERFTGLWSAHVTALFNYARGLADGDDRVRADARAATLRFETELAGVVATLSGGRLPRPAATAALRAHVEHLLGQADAYAAKDYAQADRLYREAYAHAFGLGRTLAEALVPPAQAAALRAPGWRLRSELGRLLGEHVVLVVAALRAGVTSGPDFAAAGQAVDANTQDLAGAVDTLFGAAAARRFQNLWADHVDALMAYAAAVARRDDAQRTAAVGRLDVFERQLASFLATATARRLPAATLAKAFRGHDQMLVQQVDAFVAEDYGRAHDIAYSTYEQTAGLARDLAEAFGATVASRLPRGGVQTGLGGMAAVVGRR